MTGFNLTISRLLLIGIDWYPSTNRRFIHSYLFIHSHKGGLTIGLLVKPPLMKMYKQIRKLNLKLHLKKITSKLYAKQWHIQKDFHTGIPVWAPKLWRPKKLIFFLYTNIFYYRLCFFLLTLSKFFFKLANILCSL